MQISGREVLRRRSCRAPRRPPRPWPRTNSLCSHLPGPVERERAGSANPAQVAAGPRGSRPCLMERKTDQQKRGRWGWRRSAGTREEVRGEPTRRKALGQTRPFSLQLGDSEPELLSLSFLHYKNRKTKPSLFTSKGL